jgi:hypothetical protein
VKAEEGCDDCFPTLAAQRRRAEGGAPGLCFYLRKTKSKARSTAEDQSQEQDQLPKINIAA